MAGRWCALYGPLAPVLGSRSTGLGKMVQEPQARFKVAKWGVYCHTAWLQISPACFKQVYSDSASGGDQLGALPSDHHDVRAE